MRLYLDDDTAAPLLGTLLRNAGHNVRLPTDAGISGEDDAVHPTYAIRDARVLLTGNHRDFLNLHNLLVQAMGHHPGILVVRREGKPKQELPPAGTVRAIGKIRTAKVSYSAHVTIGAFVLTNAVALHETTECGRAQYPY